jgi:di/tricarboxylate transporter
VLFLIGRADRVNGLKELGLDIRQVDHDAYLSPYGITFIEIILAPHSGAVGYTLKDINLRGRFGPTIVALRRGDRTYRTNVGDLPLAFGDSLLAIASQEQLQSLSSLDFIVIEPDPSDQPIRLKHAVLSLGAIFAAVVGSIVGAPLYLCTLVGALVVVFANVLTMEEAYRAIKWQAIFLVAGMYAVSIAMVQTGLAELLGNGMIQLVMPLGPIGLAAGAYVLTGLLTQIMGGQVTALMTGPVTISAAISMGIDPHAVAVATAIGCSASFLTPFAHPVNILMIAPANYTLRDFFRVGWGLTLVSFTTLLIGLLVFWGL